MLNELEDLQSSDEDVYGSVKVSFTIPTRSEEGDELVEREYTFSYAEPWDKWTFKQYEERRCDYTEMVSRRNWRRVRKSLWQDGDEPPEIPPEVNAQLKQLLELESMELTI